MSTPPATEMSGSSNLLAGTTNAQVTHDLMDGENDLEHHDDEEKEAEYVTPGGPDLDDLDMNEDDDTLSGGEARGNDTVHASTAQNGDVELEMGGDKNVASDSEDSLLVDPNGHVTPFHLQS